MLPREFALDVVRRLRAAGYEALWAGGCVRDQLLGIPPKDYDVATSATPDQVRDCLGRRRTLAIGASFGVITALGPREAGNIDVATFRRDAAYSDGRHPDSVSFTGAEEDARRRDFTINGLFFDPLDGRVIDYVGGQEDLRLRIVRAIGDPRQRIAEDKLRMLRAVRFAARFDFALEERTLAAVRERAGELHVVSAERIAAEMRQILTHSSRASGIEMLQAAGLLAVILPESTALNGDSWRRTLQVLDQLQQPTFAVALAALLREMLSRPDHGARQVFERWKLSTDELEGLVKLLREESLVRQASRAPWPQLQRVLVAPRVDELLDYAEAVAKVVDGDTAQIDFCREKLALPATELNPQPLLSGDDLKQLGLPPGPIYREILEAARDAQLDKQIATQEEALALARRLSGIC